MPTTNSILRKNLTENKYHTHVSMGKLRGKIEFNIQTLEEFYSYYCKDIFSKKYEFSVAEKSQHYMPVLADIDLKCKSGTKNPPFYSENDVLAVVGIYQNVLKETVANVTNEMLMCVFLAKEPYESCGNIKHGFHLHFPNCFLDKDEMREFIIPRVIEQATEAKLFPTFDITKVIDDAVCRNPWLLYGSVKEEGLKPYLVSKIFNYEKKELNLLQAFGGYSIYDKTEKPITFMSVRDIELFLPRILSIIPHCRDTHELKPGVTRLQKTTEAISREKKAFEATPLSVEESIAMAKKLVPLISASRADDYNTWKEIGWALFNISQGSDEGFEIWDDFSQKCPDKYLKSACENDWSKMTFREGGLTMGTLRYYAKIDSPDEYAQLKKQTSKESGEFVSTTDEDLANYIFNHTDLAYSSDEKQLYIYCEKTKLWKRFEKEALRTIITKCLIPHLSLIEDEEVRNQALMEIKNTKKQSCILTSLWATIVANPKNEFVDNFNKKLGFFPIADGKVIDLHTLEVRERTKEDYFSETTKREFNQTAEGETFVREYIGEILKTKNENYINWMLSVIGYCLTGENNMKHFYTFAGDTNAGKSLFLLNITRIFESLGGTANAKVFKQSKTDSVHDTETFTLLGKRCSFISELEEGEKFNQALIKKISGGDEMNIRKCGSDKNVPVKINTILMLAVNDIPKFDDADKAFIQRMRIVKFPNTFENNTTRRDAILSHVDSLFSLACTFAKRYYDNGKKFADVEEVLSSTSELVKERDTFKNWTEEHDYLIDESYIGNTPAPPVCPTEPRTKKTDVYSNYTSWCECNKVKPIGRNSFYKEFDTLYKLPTFNQGKFWRGIREKKFSE